LGLLSEEENTQLTTKFRFVLYAAFPREEDGICLEMCYGLQDLCVKHKLGIFQFIPRYSNQTKERWDDAFLDKTLY
jgi:hypothetical protein